MLDSLQAGPSMTLTRTVVLLVLAVILLDLCDASCYSFDLLHGNATIAAHESTESDACAAFCVPDCFCCCSVSAPITVALVQQPTPLSCPPALPEEFPTTGVSPTLDHVPITAV
jgi:hypothetical protein